jgi:hypothetical protein
VDAENGWIFPKTLGGLRFRTLEKYEEDNLDYKLVYQKRRSSCEVEVSVYKKGDAEEPDMILKRVEAQLEWRQQSGKIFQLKQRGEAPLPENCSAKIQSVIFEYKARDYPKMSVFKSVYAIVSKGRSVVVSLTFEQKDKEQGKEILNQLARDPLAFLEANPSKKELVLSACTVFEKKPASYQGLVAAQYIMAFAQQMDNLNVYTQFFVWPTGAYSKPENSDLLIAGYFAGMLQVVVAKELDCGGEYEAFVSMLNTYKTLKRKDQVDEIPELEKWIKAPDTQKLYNQLLGVE